ncbi:MAG: hypothetical protein Q8P41_13640 [Pseudomonadota bacterium]|nr:hypothetical protein [Pseudomonadota bacterium]
MPVDNGLVVYVPPADRRVDEARARLVLARQRTRGTLTALQREVAVRTDWHTWFRARPGMFLAAAFVAGFLIGKRR